MDKIATKGALQALSQKIKSSFTTKSDDEDLLGILESRDYWKTQYFTIKALENGSITWNVNSLKYSLNGGSWTNWNKTSGLNVQSGDKVRFKSTSTIFVIIGNGLTSTGKIEIYGNINSLGQGDDFVNSDNISANRSHYFHTENLISAKNLILPSVVSSQCYEYMFAGCSSLEEPPVLLATTLANWCYRGMFSGCSSLKKAPLLLAETLESGCYENMFLNCSSLEFVQSKARDISAGNCLKDWLSGVSENGIFVQKWGVNYPSGVSGIPEGWTTKEF